MKQKSKSLVSEGCALRIFFTKCNSDDKLQKTVKLLNGYLYTHYTHTLYTLSVLQPPANLKHKVCCRQVRRSDTDRQVQGINITHSGRDTAHGIAERKFSGNLKSEESMW